MEKQGLLLALLTFLLWSVGGIDGQSGAYISFLGDALPNHSYVNASQVGNAIDGSDSLQCHSDLVTCCSSTEGPHRGSWYFPSGFEVGFNEGASGFYVDQRAQRVDLHHGNSGILIPSGIYCCEIETRAANNGTHERVYVGIYDDGGYIDIPGLITLTVDSDLNGENPQFTLTCISTGGPATTVTWSRKYTYDPEAVTTRTVLDNPVTSQYTHTLTVTGRFGGHYECTVSNNKPSSQTAHFRVKVAHAPLDVSAFQEGPTSIHVFWVPPSTLDDTIGYRIYYSGGSNGSVDVSDGLSNNYLLTGLQNGASYTISVVGLSIHLPSEPVGSETVELAPDTPVITIFSISSDSVSFSWTTEDSLVDRYEVMWEVASDHVARFHDVITDGSESYTISGLDSDQRVVYHITVMAYNSAGRTASATVNIASDSAASSSEQESECDTGAVAAGVAVGVFVLVAIAAVIFVIAFLKFYPKSKKEIPKDTEYSNYVTIFPSAPRVAAAHQTPGELQEEQDGYETPFTTIQ